MVRRATELIEASASPRKPRLITRSRSSSSRIWRAPDNTRLVFDLSGPVQHSLFTLAAPNRIVIDVSGAQLA
ncbi:hypothetical protein CJT55_31800, partial [Pseudomonas aeruginosa]